MRLAQLPILLVATAFCSQAAAIDLQLGKAHVTTGARGLTLSIPTVTPAKSYLSPLYAFFDPDQAMSPAIFEVIPCATPKCKKQSFAARVSIRVVRLKEPDEHGNPDSEQDLLARAKLRMERMARESQDALKTFGKAQGIVIADSLHVVNIASRKWAKVRIRDDRGRETGSVYWSVLSAEYMLVASLVADPDRMPADISVAEVAVWFDGFMREVTASGRPQ